MGGQQSSETPQEEAKVEEKAPEAPKAAGPEVKEVKAEKAEVEESKKNKIPESKEAKKQSAPKVQPKAPVPPGAQTSTTLTPKQPPKAAPGAKKKVQQPGPPQQPGLITPESGKKGGKGEKGEKGKGGKKGGAGGGFPGIQLCVRNLAKEATPEQLKSMFAPFGELLSVDVKKNTDQTCRGYGFVTFAKMEDAKKAIGQMDNKQVEGKNLVVVLSDRQQGTTKAEREAQVTTKGGKGKDVKGDAKGKGGKGKAKGAPPAPAPPAPGAAQAWPSQAPPEASYPYNYGGYPMVSPMAAYANQGYPNSQQAAAIAMQASILQAQQQAIQSQAAWYSMGLHQQLGGNAPQARPPTVSLAAAAAPSSKNGYGFISCNETKAHYKRDVFVDSSILPEGIQVNDKVTFSLSLSEKGHPRATAVKLVGQVMAAR